MLCVCGRTVGYIILCMVFARIYRRRLEGQREVGTEGSTLAARARARGGCRRSGGGFIGRVYDIREPPRSDLIE